ncbi:hypothetical protein [Enemella evansiae]|uniref:hypothetical protein n=1 Tax=Enemella evansiae TaxID=2016499 RepID=UPI00117FFDA5|nr:hypothetical protein [Enemella evansiae]
MVGRRAVCGIGLGLGLAAAGCTPTGRLRVDPAPVSATPLQRRTSEDPDTNRILTEIGTDVLQLTVYPDRVYVTTVDRRNLVSSGGPFAIAPEAPVPDMFRSIRAAPFPADAFLVGRARELLQSTGGSLGTIGQPYGQLILDIMQGDFPNQRRIRCAVAPGREVPAYDFWTEQGVADGLAELSALRPQATYSIGLFRLSRQEASMGLRGRMADQDRIWGRDQYRPLVGSRLGGEPFPESFDPAVVNSRGLLRVSDELLRRSGREVSTSVDAVSRNGTPVLEIYAGSDDGPRLTGTADLDGRILELR